MRCKWWRVFHNGLCSFPALAIPSHFSPRATYMAAPSSHIRYSQQRAQLADTHITRFIYPARPPLVYSNISHPSPTSITLLSSHPPEQRTNDTSASRFPPLHTANHYRPARQDPEVPCAVTLR